LNGRLSVPIRRDGRQPKNGQVFFPLSFLLTKTEQHFNDTAVLMGAECDLKDGQLCSAKMGCQGVKCAVDRNFAIKNETFLDC
jgi:hypothetical protein